MGQPQFQSSSYTKLVSSLLFPLHERIKNHSSTKSRRELELSEWLDEASFRSLQSKRLQWFLSDVQKHVPYYREMFGDREISICEDTDVDILKKLPCLTKDLIRTNTERLKSEQATSLSRYNTGGSSGQPLVFYIGNERVSHDVAAKWRATRWWDVDIGDPEIVIWGSPIELGAQDKIRVLRDKVFRTHLLEAFEMSDRKLKEFINKIKKVKPKMLFGYPSALALIGKFAEDNNISVSNLGIKVAFVTSEYLYDHQRDYIEKAFGCRVANGYGGRDAGFIAHACPSGSMHITAEDIIVETLDKYGNSVPLESPGEIVVTHLATREFPFIRYRTGDIGVLTDARCDCGRILPVLKDIQGRTTDFVIKEDGAVMHGLALIYILRDSPKIKQFKIVQESKLHTRIELILHSPLTNEEAENIKCEFQARLGSSVSIEVQIVDNIPAEKSGKYRYVISHAT